MEALRSGVPNADAVALLGSGQGDIEDRFATLLDDVKTAPNGLPERGSMLIGGGFGEGKSHLLMHLAKLATASGFVVSTVVVSKETPLYDPVKVFRAAIESAQAPGGVRDVVAETASALEPDSLGYAELLRWLRGSGNDLNERFEATLLLHQRLGGDTPGLDEEFFDTITRFWSGDTLPMPDLRRQLKAVGEARTFSFAPINLRDLARQRFRFLPRLLRAGGHAGWVILFDEVELIGRYSVLQRGRSYAELTRWLVGDRHGTGDPLVAVMAMTDDFEAAVLSGKKDRDVLPGKLRDKQTDEYAEMAALAETGMQHIARETQPLRKCDAAELDRAYRTLKQLHGTAYGWDPPDVAGLERLGATRMRQYVRAWINEWDLVGLDPDYRPATLALDVNSDYREQDRRD